MSIDKQYVLDTITKEIESCLTCKNGTSGKAVPGEGNPNAGIVFVGEAPGKTEAETGRPFVGRSGKLLRSLITDIGLQPSEVFITSVVKYLPDRGTPSPAQIAHGRIHLQKQLSVIDPKLIVLLGSVAVQGVLEEKLSINQYHGKTIEKNGRHFVIMFHPLAALRFPPIKEKLIKDFQEIKKLL